MFTYAEAESGSIFPKERFIILVVASLLVALPIILILGLLAIVLSSAWLWALAFLAPFLVAGILYWRSRQRIERVLDSLDVQASTFEQYPRLHNLVESLSLDVGVSEPECYVTQDPSVNAVALADPERNVVVITSGAVETLGLAEVEGIVGELLVRLKSGDADDATFAASLFGIPLVDGSNNLLLTRFADWATSQVLDEDRELAADRQAVLLTSYPPGLVAALENSLENGFVPKTATEGTDYLWMVPPSTAQVARTLRKARASLGLRVDVLSSEI